MFFPFHAFWHTQNLFVLPGLAAVLFFLATAKRGQRNQTFPVEWCRFLGRIYPNRFIAVMEIVPQSANQINYRITKPINISALGYLLLSCNTLHSIFLNGIALTSHITLIMIRLNSIAICFTSVPFPCFCRGFFYSFICNCFTWNTYMC